MPVRPFKLSDDSVQLPRGTRVVLRTDIKAEDGFVHRMASVAVVRDNYYSTYVLETPSGRELTAQRDQITPQRQDSLAALGRRQWDFRRLESEIVYAAIVGSKAWGLADERSDEDVRGCFVAPFEEHVGLFDYPDELADPDSDAQYWEVEKLIHQALRGDANTLETLWSPLVKVVTPLGQSLVDRRRIFVSMSVLGSFGRYAQSQFKRIERALKRDAAIGELFAAAEHGKIETVDAAAEFLRDRRVAPNLGEARREVHAVVRSVFDRGLIGSATFEALVGATAEGRRADLQPPPHRPKNAYNLLRLLHSCLSWLRTGEPMIEVKPPLRDTLLAIKHQEVSIERVIALAKEVAKEVDETAGSARLPQQPDYEAADELLRTFRRESARRSLGVGGETTSVVAAAQRKSSETRNDAYVPTLFPVALPPDIDVPPLREFLSRYVDAASPEHVDLIWLALSGAHAYGFPSPDSDLDLKAIHTGRAREVMGLTPTSSAIELVTDWRGREYDFSSNELGQAALLILKGNGNMLERLLGPMPILTTPVGHRLRELARASLSRAVYGHYSGFLRGMVHESEVEARGGGRTAKRLLYAYRVALTGIHALLTGEIDPDVTHLAPAYGYERALALVRIKTQAERVTVEDSEAAHYLADIERLGQALDDARERSILPEESPNREELEEFVVVQRLSRAAGGR